MRDLLKAKAICEAATSGPWEWMESLSPEMDEIKSADSTVIYIAGYNTGDAEFIATARTGWPEAIDRAIAAEKENTELRQKLDIALTALQKYEVTGKVLGEVAREAIHTIQGEETKG